MDLLSRLQSTSVVVTPKWMTPEKYEALEHIMEQPDGAVTMTRRRGEDLPKGWEVMWQMCEAGWVSEPETKRDDALGFVTYRFVITVEGKAKLATTVREEIAPPPPPPPKKKRRRGPAAKTGKPGL